MGRLHNRSDVEYYARVLCLFKVLCMIGIYLTMLMPEQVIKDIDPSSVSTLDAWPKASYRSYNKRMGDGVSLATSVAIELMYSLGFVALLVLQCIAWYIPEDQRGCRHILAAFGRGCILTVVEMVVMCVHASLHSTVLVSGVLDLQLWQSCFKPA